MKQAFSNISDVRSSASFSNKLQLGLKNKQTIKTPGICSENKPNQVVFWRSPKSQLCKCTKIISKQTFASSPFCHSALSEVQGPRIWRAGTLSAEVCSARGVGVHFDLCRRANLPAHWTGQWEHSHPCLSQSQPEMCQESYIKPATYSPTPIWGPRICSTPRASWASLDRATRNDRAGTRPAGSAEFWGAGTGARDWGELGLPLHAVRRPRLPGGGRTTESRWSRSRA